MEYFSGQGELFAGERDRNGVVRSYRSLGNCSNFTVSIGPGGLGTINVGPLRRTGSLPTVEIDFENFNKENMASLLAGGQRVISGGNFTDSVLVKPGEMVPLSHINLLSFNGLTSPGGIPYDSKQYQVNMGAGAVIFPANSTIPAGTNATASYSTKPSVALGVFNKNPAYLSLRFNGINSVDLAPVVLELFKVKLDPVDALSLINDNLSSLKVAGRVFKDDGVNANLIDGPFMRLLRT